ncbi:long-chain-fatty-acid--CoA ligase 5-like [Physella acuta]|uniref:long-chain-fatty-acid--CoA ligase 5-like n=1 Tax=Physella acuta TaxID=109671 RepID=UPI0027DBA448|nr:long-chain-fatty-acid--CoA ligase 5-like [Physella acuta]
MAHGVTDLWATLQKYLKENQNVALAAGVTALAGLAAASYWSLIPGTKPVEPIIDLNNQSVIIDGKPEHRGSWLSHPPDYKTFDRYAPECQVIYDVLERGRRLSDNGPCLGARTGPNREYEWITYQQFIDQVHQFGSAVVAQGYPPTNESFVGIYCSNRPEWVISDYGSQAFSMYTVPLYDTLALDTCLYVLNQCGMKLVVVDEAKRLNNLLQLKPQVPTLKVIVVIEPITEEQKTTAAQLGVKLIQFYEFLEIGKRNLQSPVPGKPSDIVTILYTSGTTGNPKGVELSQNSFMSMADSVLVAIGDKHTFNKNDVHLSYLPLAHNFDRTIVLAFLCCGARIGFYSRNPALILDDMAALRPTLFPSVPRLFNRIYDGVMSEIKSSSIKSTLFRWAIESKTKEINKRIIRRDSFWDKLIFRKIQNKLGGRIRLIITGSAPLSPQVMQFLRCAFGCPVVEGYGQTEAGAGLAISIIGNPLNDSIGPPLPGVQIKLVDVPALDYYAKDNIGEVCAKGDLVFSGYYKQPDITAETLDKDGWLHTGDVGRWAPNGALVIVDRVKHIFKLSQGEYIAPEMIENVYKTSQFVCQCFVDGDCFKNFIMGIVVPDAEFISKWAPNNGFPADIKLFCQSKEAHDLVLKDMLERGKASGLRGFEQVKDITLIPEMFTVESNLLTPTLKNKRPVLRKTFEAQMKELYARNE